MKHAIRVTLAVFLALLTSYYVNTHAALWLVLAALLTSIVPVTIPLRERIIVLVMMLAGLALAAINLSSVSENFIPIVLGLVFVIIAMALTQSAHTKNNIFLLSFFLIFMVFLLLPHSAWRDCFVGCVVGNVIGIFCSVLVLAGNFEDEFSRGVLPSLQAMDKNLEGLQQIIDKDDEKDVSQKIFKLQRIGGVQQNAYPEWVFNAGFNPGLRSGSRFFLIKLEQAQEALCALNYLVLRDLQIDILRDQTSLFVKSLQGNRDLLATLIHYFQKKTMPALQQDFTSDISALETVLQKTVPPKLELLEIAPEYLALTAFVRELKDLRQLLLQLTAALPAAEIISASTGT